MASERVAKCHVDSRDRCSINYVSMGRSQGLHRDVFFIIYVHLPVRYWKVYTEAIQSLHVGVVSDYRLNTISGLLDHGYIP